MRLTGRVATTVSGLGDDALGTSKEGCPAAFLMVTSDFPLTYCPKSCLHISVQGTVTAEVAAELGLAEGYPRHNRAGDQPNNALSLNVFNPW